MTEDEKMQKYWDWFNHSFEPSVKAVFGNDFDIHEVWKIQNSVLKDSLKQRLATVDEKVRRQNSKAYDFLLKVANGEN